MKTAWDGPPSDMLTECGQFRSAGLWAIDSFNGNCGDTALAYLSRSTADACLLQEMKCRSTNIDQQARTAAGHGWKLSCGPATITEKDGVSSGVAVAVLAHLGLAHPLKKLGEAADATRICVRWVG